MQQMEEKKVNSHQVSVAAESITATLFAWAGYDVSVQYGANQPEYDLVVVQGAKMLKVSVKGSQDGGWGLTQNLKKGRTYSEAAEKWMAKHSARTILSLVQFKDIDIEKGELPRVYIATPSEICNLLSNARGGHGDTVVKENYTWITGVAKGITDKIPNEWIFSKQRISELMVKVVGEVGE
jgi:hypothetical protein